MVLFQFHIACHALIDVFTARRGLAPLEYSDESIGVLAAFVLALCEGIAWLIRVLYWDSAAVIMFDDHIPVSGQLIDPAARLRHL